MTVIAERRAGEGDDADVVAVIVTPSSEMPWPRRWMPERFISRREADAIAEGRLASHNLYCSLDGEARRILVRVFEKHCCHAQGERSMMPTAKYEVRAVVGLGAGSRLPSLPGRSGAETR